MNQDAALRTSSEVNSHKGDLRKLKRELSRAKQESDSLFQAMTTLSHEIRTPLTAIIGSTDVLLDDAPSQTEKHEMVQTIKRNGQHLLELVNDALELARIDAGHIEWHATAFQPLAFLEEVISSLRPLASSKGLSLELMKGENLPPLLHCDLGRLRQILLNLLGNALRYTAAGRVTLVARLVSRREGPMFVVDIRDSGMGISPEHQGKIFEPFEQARASDRLRGGSGLGLAISRRVARLMGGDVKLVASEPGRGSIFRAWVRAELRPSIESGMDLGRPSDCASRADRLAPMLRHMRILVAEDCIDNRRLIVRILKKAGATITSVGNGRDAANAALRAKRRGEPFAVVVMDVYMPRMGGEEAVRRLRDRGYDGKVVALTACAMAGERERIMKAGFDRYLAKPINRVQLIDTLAECKSPVRCNPEHPIPTRTHDSLGLCRS